MLFAGVALSLIVAMGAGLYRASTQAQVLRQRLAATGQQLLIYGDMQQQAWSYLERLLVARRAKQDTRQLLQEQEQLIRQDFDKLRQGLQAELQWAEVQITPEELESISALEQARLEWARHVEEVLHPKEGEGPSPEVWWSLLATYERQVRPHAAKAWEFKNAKLRVMQEQLDVTLRRAQWLGRLVPVGAGVLLLLLMVLLLVPLYRGLRKLRAGAERIGQGDFTVELPVERKDELGALAQAFNQTTKVLRDTLQEREQLMKAEAEAAERERRQNEEVAASDIRRYTTLLEQMVRTRTAELESSNAQLANSLRQLQAVQAQLMFTDRLAAMGRLAAGVAHEINNPLVYVISNINFLRTELQGSQGAPSEEERKELLGAIDEAREGAERVRLIVQDLKTLSRPDDANTGTADLVAVVRSAAKIAAHEVRRRARLVEDFQDVPLVRGNAARLGQVFLNLLINAAHAIPEGHADVNEIRVVARMEGPERIVVEVRDTGCGISPEHLERIFDPFFTTKPSGQGTGLGLSLCHNIVTALGGTISVESEVGRGTTFRVSLPAVVKEGQASA